MGERVFPVVVVGGGVGGSAATLRAAQYMLEVAWVRGDLETSKRSRGHWVYNLDNMVGTHPDIVRGKVVALLKRKGMKEAAAVVRDERLRITTRDIAINVVRRLRQAFPNALVLERPATAARREEGHFAVELEGGKAVRGESLVVSTGVMDRQPKVKVVLADGTVDDDIRWVYPYANQETLLYCIRCEGHLVRGTPVVVIGAGSPAAEVALILCERYAVRVTLLTNGEAPGFPPESARLLEAYGVACRRERLTELLEPPRQEGEHRIQGSQLLGVRLEGGDVIEARFGIVALGLWRVYNELPRMLGAALADEHAPEERRHVLIDEVGETTVPGLFCVGDMAAQRGAGPVMKQVYTAQEYAVRAIDAIDRRRRLARRAEVLADR